MAQISKNIIFIEEYGLYQYFAEEKSFFTHDASICAPDFSITVADVTENLNPVTPNVSQNTNKFISMAVISKNIIFSKASETSNLGGLLPNKTRKINRYLSRYYKNESYFPILNSGRFMGVYHTHPSNVKKYYSVSGIAFVIPYDFLVILFLRQKLPSFEINGDALLFIEEGAGIYKITVMLKGLSLFPVASFKEDVLIDNLSILKTKLISAGISMGNIVSNVDMPVIRSLFPNVSELKYSSKEFFEFFGTIGANVPHFENIEVRFSKIRARKRKVFALYIASEAIMVFAALLVLIIVRNKVNAEQIKSKVLRKEISEASFLLNKRETEVKFKKKFSPVNSWKFLRSVIGILPVHANISYLYLVRPELKNYYLVAGKAFFNGGYHTFAAQYNYILNKPCLFKHFRLICDMNKFENPYVKFYGKIKFLEK